MQFAFGYEKNKVIQALRLHFIKQKEIRLLIILVNLFTITAAIFFAIGKIQPQPFFIGTIIWLLVLLGIWYVLPYSIYSKNEIFKEQFIAYINTHNLLLESDKGKVSWDWNRFTHFFESPLFFHLYLNKKSFFLLPKEGLHTDEVIELKQLLLNQIKE
jgi:hypothetical protein